MLYKSYLLSIIISAAQTLPSVSHAGQTYCFEVYVSCHKYLPAACSDTVTVTGCFASAMKEADI